MTIPLQGPRAQTFIWDMATMQTLMKNVDGRTLNQLLAEGLMSELSYMTAEEAEQAARMEADLIAAARAEEK